MTKLSDWKVVETPCTLADAPGLARAALGAGAAGAVTSGGSGMKDRQTLRVYWRGTESSREGERLSEVDWTDHWREALKPFRAGRNFLLSPPWVEGEPENSLTRIVIDPGMAFGAGDHPTTRLCVGLLEEIAGTGEKPHLLDVGAGTGVLSLVWAALGGRADALDIDPFCTASCERNVAANGAEGKVKPLLLSLDLLDESYRLVAANVVGSQLASLAGELARVCEQGGQMLLSGFEKEAGERVFASFGNWFDHLETREEEGWLALRLRRSDHTGGA